MFKFQYSFMPLIMWLIGSSFFCYQFILRLWPSLLMQDLMQQFAIDATSFGIISAMYYYGYSTMQIPIAVMLDRYGVKRILTSCIILCSAATILFTYTNNLYIAMLGRFLVGAGSAVGFLGASKVISQWFPEEKYTRMVGFTFSFGLVGAVYGGKPISILVNNFGWQQISYSLAFIAFIIAMMVLLFLNAPTKATNNEKVIKLSQLKLLLSSKSLWTLALANLLMVGSLEGFADVWGLNYLVTAYGYNKSDAAEIVSALFVGMLFGGPLLALCSDKIGKIYTIILSGLSMASLFLILLFAKEWLNWYTVVAILFLIGIFCCYQVIVFSVGSIMVDNSLLGITIALLNCINMLGGSFFHSVIGKLMDLSWTGEMQNGINYYNIESYQNALLVIPGCAIVASIMLYILKLKSTISLGIGIK